jgi:hypothetical protein
MRLLTPFLFAITLSLSHGLATGPRGEAMASRRRQRETMAFRKRQRVDRQGTAESVAFDAKALVHAQQANEDALPLDLSKSSLKIMMDVTDSTTGVVSTTTTDISTTSTTAVEQPAFRFLPLGELFPTCSNISKRFCTDGSFRNSLRDVIRCDLSDSNPTYQNLSKKAKSFLLQPETSVQGSWKCVETPRLSQMFKKSFWEKAPTGTELLQTIGDICGPNASSTHWIDIVGVLDRDIKHSWHQDTGRPTRIPSCAHFPPRLIIIPVPEFSHICPLSHKQLAPPNHNGNEPVLFQGSIDEQHIGRSSFGMGREPIVYRDVDVLHSAPDVSYRTHAIRFM